MKKIFCFILSFVTACLALSTEAMAVFSSNISAASAILINADTGTVIYAKNEHKQRAIASTTKIMTALITIEAEDLDKSFEVDSYAIKVEGTSMGLREGDIVTRRALCYGLLLPSGNDAANACAVSVAGSITNFSEKMNQKAKEIGMTNSNFVTPSGLDAKGHYSTAYDMALLTMEAMKNPIFREICSKTSAEVEFGNPPYKRYLYNSNKLLKRYNGCIGVKTGFTDNARRCLVSAAERDGVNLIAVTLNAGDDWNDHEKMLNYGFSQIKSRDIDYDLPELSVNVVGGEKQKINVKLKEPVSVALLPEEYENVKLNIYVRPFIYAGFSENEPVGYVAATLNNKTIGKWELVPDELVSESSKTLSFIDKIIQFFKQNF